MSAQKKHKAACRAEGERQGVLFWRVVQDSLSRQRPESRKRVALRTSGEEQPRGWALPEQVRNEHVTVVGGGREGEKERGRVRQAPGGRGKDSRLYLERDGKPRELAM